MKVQLWTLDRIKPYEKNPRKNDDAVAAVAASIRQFGFRPPIVVDGDGVIVCGHTRWRAARELGLAKVPVHVAEDLSPEQVRAYRIADNKTADLASWDTDLLSSELTALADLDVDLSGLGFSLDDLADILPQAPGLTDPDSVPEPPEEPVTQPGDLWSLGEHRLLCGDATDRTAPVTLLDGARAAMLFTDPPYAIYGSSTGVSANVADDKMVRPFFRDVLLLAVEHTRAFAHLYICCDWRSWAAWWDMAKAAQVSVKNCIVWDKVSAGMGSMFRNRHELLIFATNSRVSTTHMRVSTTHMSGATAGQRMVTDENVWTIKREPAAGKKHNAQKPVDLIARAVEASSDDGDIVLDPFCGSGTTIIACEQTGRRCWAIEIEPRYVDVAVRRWEEFTGRKAEKECGRTGSCLLSASRQKGAKKGAKQGARAGRNNPPDP